MELCGVEMDCSDISESWVRHCPQAPPPVHPDEFAAPPQTAAVVARSALAAARSGDRVEMELEIPIPPALLVLFSGRFCLHPTWMLSEERRETCTKSDLSKVFNTCIQLRVCCAPKVRNGEQNTANGTESEIGILRLAEFVVVLGDETHNPSVLNPDYLL